MARSRLAPLSPALLLALLASACTLTPPEGGFRGVPAGRDRIREVHARLGAASLDGGTWGDLDRPTQIAVDFAEETPTPWLLLDVGFHLGQDEEGGRLTNGDRAEEGVTTFELSGGLLARPSSPDAWLRPYAGVGLSALYAEADLVADDELVGARDTALGVYAKTGLMVPLGPAGWLGLELRVLEASSIDTAAGPRDVGGAQLALVLGASF